jgi:DsbC/DsbD-like thiol-disulfide interchange protein
MILSSLGTMSAAQSLDGIAQLEVLPGWETSDGTHMAALRVTLAPGWKTYWRAPGDAGIPPMFTWTGSDNIAAAQFHWPVPEVFHQQGLRSIGYHDGVVIPIELTPTNNGAAMHMAGQMNFGVCDEICVPIALDFAAALPRDGGRNPAIVASLINQPLTTHQAGVQSVTCAIDPADNGVQITAAIAMQSTGREEIVIEAGDPAVWVSEPSVSRAGGQITAVSRMVHRDGGAFALDRSAVRITVIGNGQAVDIVGCAAG